MKKASDPPQKHPWNCREGAAVIIGSVSWKVLFARFFSPVQISKDKKKTILVVT